MKYNRKQSSLLILFALFLVAFCFIACDTQDDKEQRPPTPKDLYQTSWRGIGHCDGWSRPKDRGISIQFVDTLKGKVIWQDYGGTIDITYTIEGRYMKFNDKALLLAGAPWVIKSYTKDHMTLIQNEASPDKNLIATIELDRID